MVDVAALFFAGVVTLGGHVRADDGWGAYNPTVIGIASCNGIQTDIRPSDHHISHRD
jgi:mannose/fructose/N-acetylgalactosamine-specific phosphotransferase system component IIC